MLSDYITTIRAHLEAPEAIEALDKLEEGLGQVDWQIGHLAMTRLVEEERFEELMPWIDRVEASLKKYFMVYPGQENAFRTDVEVFGMFARHYAEHGDVAGMESLLSAFPDMFNVNGKQKCAALRSRCKTAGHDTKDKCTHRFYGKETTCPDCGEPRAFCQNSPEANGRCRYHGGLLAPVNEDALMLPGNDRGLIYQNAFNSEKLSARFKAALKDPNYLSLAPEIALIGSRIAGLIEEVEEIDYNSIRSKIESELRKMEKSVVKGQLDDASIHAQNIIRAMNEDAAYRKSWESIAGLTSILRGLTETDRKRIVDAQRIITIEEMLQLRNRTMNLLIEAIDRSSRFIAGDMITITRQLLEDDESTRLIAATALRDNTDQIEDKVKKRFTTILKEVMTRERAKEKRALDMNPEPEPNIIDGD